MQGPAALLAAVGAIDPGAIDLDDAEWVEPQSHREFLLDELRRAVGSDDALAGLDDRPLPDEPLVWDDVPDDIHARVAEVFALCDGWCDEVLDVEHRTACRRFVARVAASDPAFFRRRSRAETAAAGACWVIGQANHSLSTGPGRYVKDLVAHFGVSPGAPSERGLRMLVAAGIDVDAYGPVRVGTPELLTSERRRGTIDARDRYLGLDDEDW